MDGAEGDFVFVTGVEGKGEADEDEGEFDEHFVPVEAVAVADEPLQRFDGGRGDGGEHDTAVEGVEAPEGEGGEIADGDEEKEFENFVGVVRDGRKRRVGGEEDDFDEDGDGDDEDPDGAESGGEYF